MAANLDVSHVDVLLQDKIVDFQLNLRILVGVTSWDTKHNHSTETTLPENTCTGTAGKVSYQARL